MQSNQSMADAMKGVTVAMRSMNKQVNLPQITKIMQDFEKENEMMDMKEEMMNDAIDDVIDEDQDEAEEDEIVMKVLDEIGIDLDQKVFCIFILFNFQMLDCTIHLHWFLRWLKSRQISWKGLELKAPGSPLRRDLLLKEVQVWMMMQRSKPVWSNYGGENNVQPSFNHV
jgi:hypothetical protein